VQAILGTDDVSSSGKGTKINVKRIAVARSTKKNVRADIALVQLSRSVRFSDKIRPICLRDQSVRPDSKEYCSTAGWGIDDTRTRTSS